MAKRAAKVWCRLDQGPKSVRVFMFRTPGGDTPGLQRVFNAIGRVRAADFPGSTRAKSGLTVIPVRVPDAATKRKVIAALKRACLIQR
jgi:hypothetical protein